jgi:hypothetical protein
VTRPPRAGVVANNPDMVSGLERGIAEMLRTFSDGIQKANADVLE